MHPVETWAKCSLFMNVSSDLSESRSNALFYFPQTVPRSRQCTITKPSNLMNWAWRGGMWSRCTGKWQMVGTRESGYVTCNGDGFLRTSPWRLRMPTQGQETCDRRTSSTSTSPTPPWPWCSNSQPDWNSWTNQFSQYLNQCPYVTKVHVLSTWNTIAVCECAF